MITEGNIVIQVQHLVISRMNYVMLCNIHISNELRNLGRMDNVYNFYAHMKHSILHMMYIVHHTVKIMQY